ncbi:MAG: hypothetical protein R3F54_23105 [Alphaproteobacteria bacterium]
MPLPPVQAEVMPKPAPGLPGDRGLILGMSRFSSGATALTAWPALDVKALARDPDNAIAA